MNAEIAPQGAISILILALLIHFIGVKINVKKYRWWVWFERAEVLLVLSASAGLLYTPLLKWVTSIARSIAGQVDSVTAQVASGAVAGLLVLFLVVLIVKDLADGKSSMKALMLAFIIPPLLLLVPGAPGDALTDGVELLASGSGHLVNAMGLA